MSAHNPAVNNFQTRPGKKGPDRFQIRPFVFSHISKKYLFTVPSSMPMLSASWSLLLAAQVFLHLGAHFFPVVSGIFRISGNQVAFICIALYGTSHGIGYFHGDIGECGNKARTGFTREILSFSSYTSQFRKSLLPAAVFAVVLGINHYGTCLPPACQLHRWSCQAVLRA